MSYLDEANSVEDFEKERMISFENAIAPVFKQGFEKEKVRLCYLSKIYEQFEILLGIAAFYASFFIPFEFLNTGLIRLDETHETSTYKIVSIVAQKAIIKSLLETSAYVSRVEIELELNF